MPTSDQPSTPAVGPSTAAAVLPAMAARDLRLTRHRSAILAVLDGADRPLTTDEIVERSGVPTSTAYRNLAELVDAGVVARVAAAGGDRHELAEPYSASRHHHHLVCVDCGVVTDFEPSRELERLIDREVAALLADHGFEPTEHLFDVRGRCRDCQTG